MIVPSNILLVDSNPPDRGILRNRLRDAGHTVQEESDWNRGLELAKEHRWDAIVVASRSEGVLLGKLMPQLAQGFAQREFLSVIVYEARQGAEDVDVSLAFAAGADAFVSRGELPALAALVQSQVSQRRHLRQIHENQRVQEHRRRVLQDAPAGSRSLPSSGGLEAVMLADNSGMVLASDAGAGKLIGASPVGSAISEALPHLRVDRLVGKSALSPLVSEPFEQPSGLGPAGMPLELNMVTLLSEGEQPSLKLVMVTQKTTNGNSGGNRASDPNCSVTRQLGLEKAASHRFGLASFLGKSAAVVALRESAAQAAKSKQPFLIIGGPGAGSTALAKAIHCTADPLAPLEQLQADSLPSRWVLEALTESSPHHKAQLPEKTYLISHVDRMSLEQQSALADLASKGRLLLTSHSAPSSLHPRLAQAVGDHFVVVPSLRERMEDLPTLAKHFVADLSAGATIDFDAIQALLRYPWPGNVLELEGCCRIAHLAASAQTQPGQSVHVRAEHLPESITKYRFQGPAVASSQEGKPWEIRDSDPISFDLYEKKVILRALDHCRGNRLACARLLRLGKSTLYRKLKRLGIDTEDE